MLHSGPLTAPRYLLFDEGVQLLLDGPLSLVEQNLRTEEVWDTSIWKISTHGPNWIDRRLDSIQQHHQQMATSTLQFAVTERRCHRQRRRCGHARMWGCCLNRFFFVSFVLKKPQFLLLLTAGFLFLLCLVSHSSLVSFPHLHLLGKNLRPHSK